MNPHTLGAGISVMMREEIGKGGSMVAGSSMGGGHWP